MATVGYIRVSTSEQSESGLGLEAQEAAIRARYDVINTVYRDEGYSGADSKRPALLACIDALRRGDVLVVAKRDRLARDVFLAAKIDDIDLCVRWIFESTLRNFTQVLNASFGSFRNKTTT